MTKPSLAPRGRILLQSIAILAITLVPTSSESQCCGGGGGGGASGIGGIGGHGLLDLSKTFKQKRLRLTIHPGNKAQELQVRNYITGTEITTIAIPATPGTPIGKTFSMPRGGAIAIKLVDSAGSRGGVNEGGSEANCQSGGNGDTGAVVNGEVESEETCPPPCDPTVPFVSGVLTPTPTGTDQIFSDEEGSCEDDAGAGAPDDNDGGDPAGDGANGGTGGAGQGGPAGGGTGGPEPDTLYEGVVDDLKRTAGAADLKISLGPKLPPLRFSARDLAAATDSEFDDFRGLLSAALIMQNAPTLSVDEHCREYAIRTGAKVLTDVDTNRIRSIYLLGRGVVKVIEDGETLTIRFSKLKESVKEGGGAVILGGDHVGIVNGYYEVTPPNSSANITPPPYCIWSISKVTADNKNWLEIATTAQRVNGSWKGRPKSWRYRQFVEKLDATSGQFEELQEGENPGTAETQNVTRMVDEQTGIIRDFLQKDDNTAQKFMRGQRAISASGAVTGWKAVAFGNSTNVLQPVLGPGESGLTKVHLGGAQNTLWQWSTNGMFEKTVVSPSVDAPQRSVTVLRPWGATIDPTSATEANAHAVATSIHPLQHGKAVTTVEKINGLEVKWTVDTQIAYPQEVPDQNQPVVCFSEVRQRFPNGFTSVPTVEFTKRRSRAEGLMAGRPIQSQSADGTVTNYAHAFLGIAGDPPSDLPFLKTTAVATTLEGITRQQEITEDGFGREVHRASGYVLQGAFHPVSETRAEYSDLDGGLLKRERYDFGTSAWMPSFQVTYTGANPTTITHTDEAGVVTTEELDSEQRPITITRAKFTANAIDYVPAQITRREYDTDGNLELERIVRPGGGGAETTLKKTEWKYYSDGRLKSETLNDAVTTAYEYESTGAGSEIVRMYRKAGEAAANGDPVQITTTDWSGRNSSVTGPGVVSETRVYEPITPVGGRRIRETVTRGSGSATIVSKRELDGLGRTLAELIPGTASSYRTVGFDQYGRRTTETAANQTTRQTSYNGYSATTTTSAFPDDDRTTNRDHAVLTEQGALWDVVRDGDREYRTKLTALASGVLSVRSSGPRDTPSRFTTVTTSRGGNGLVITSVARPGVSNASVSESYDGLTISTKAHSGDPGTKHEFDELGRMVKTTDFSGRRVTQTQYDPVFGQPSNVTTVDTQANPPSSGTSQTVNTYYPATSATPGRLWFSTVNGSTTNYAWTARGELGAQWGATYPVKYEYDDAGRLWKMRTYRAEPGTNPATWGAGDVTEWIYHAGTALLQQKKDAAGAGPTYTYDTRGRLSVRTWARTVNGNPLTTTYSYNSADDLRFINYSDTTPDVTITRDDKGRVIGVTDGEGLHTYTRNDDGTIASETLPGVGAGAAMEYGYDQYGRRTCYSVWNGNGSWVTWQGWGIDSATGRYSGINTPDGWIPFSYDNQKGLFTGWTVPGGTGPIAVTRTYDGLGRITSAQSTVNGQPATTRAYGYDAQHRRNSLADESGEKWNYTYNGRSEVRTGTKTYVDTNGVTRTVPGMYREYNYDAIGNRTKLHINENDRDWTPNALNQIASREVQGKQYVLGEAAPTPATVGVTAIGDQVYAAPTNVTVTRGAAPKDETFSAMIDLKQKEKTKNLSVTIQENNNGTITEETGHIFVPASPEVFSYDLDGNLTQDGRWTYQWDAENRLVQMETRSDLTVYGSDQMRKLRLRFGYDAFWRRSYKETAEFVAFGYVIRSTKRFTYNGRFLVAEQQLLPNNTAKICGFHWGLDLSGSKSGGDGVNGLVLYRTNEESSILCYDGNGNIVGAISISGGERIADVEYGPYGEVLKVTGSLEKLGPFRYSSRYVDEESGLACYQFRYYSPNAGRWLSRDPAEEKGGVNLYGFVRNSPLDLVDLYGLGWIQRFEKLTEACKGLKKAERLKEIAELRKQAENAIKSLTKNLEEHRQKLKDYIANPDKFDNLGHLANAPTPEIRKKIIEGRIKHLNDEIREFENQVTDAKSALAKLAEAENALNSCICIAGTLVGPHLSQINEYQAKGVDATVGEVLAALALDIASLLDPGVLDLFGDE